ncbi:MAG: response regulator [Desulfobacterales bacterium]
MASVLVIEDDGNIRELIEAALTRFGHRVETAGDGREGICKFDAGAFDLVITDFLLPDVDGAAVIAHIRRSLAGRRLPAIGISGTPWLMQDAGFDLVLAKPFPLGRLLESVNRLVIPPQAAEAAA